MSREEALKFLREHVQTENLVNHMLATEAVMRSLARHFAEDEDTWGLVGLLHDVDYDYTKDDPQRHAILGSEILEKRGFPPEVVRAVKAHNNGGIYPREKRIDQALFATDPTTGLIVAGALIKKEKSLAAIDVPFLLKRMKEKSFARGANREQIRTCTELDLTLEAFLGLSLEAMRGIAPELGLA
ncbi:MAG: HDIG domain-containing protein [Syntrophomonadaceae bacterium]|nr:HDIG domain-containing protein [Syntrophomonadaceae bacterium]